jgi:hypothetical protein
VLEPAGEAKNWKILKYVKARIENEENKEDMECPKEDWLGRKWMQTYASMRLKYIEEEQLSK